ncbi:MAG: RimK family alpha-L-glutamate ligase [Candidatus Electrothrix sp. AR3]|nr:RimK family alpha-L-glutamate ligase [Candidatus Electrothrix sp. AR3]
MKGWILYKDSANSLKPEAYEINRFVEIAKDEGIELDVFQPEQFDLTVTREDRQSVLIDGEAIKLPDFVLPRMGAGTTYFALAIIRHLERLGVFCVNSSQSIETVKDKLYTHQILAENNLPVPKTMLVKFPVDVDLVEKHLKFPVVVKTLSGSQGSGVFLSETKSSFKDLMQLIEATNKTANIILQEFIADSKGRDLRVITIGGRVVGSMQRIANKGDFKSNFSSGGKVEQFAITPEIEWMATQTSQILGLDIAGVDLLFDGKHYKVCEANSSTGFEGMESCSDVNIAKEIYHFIRVRTGIFTKTANKSLESEQ